MSAMDRRRDVAARHGMSVKHMMSRNRIRSVSLARAELVVAVVRAGLERQANRRVHVARQDDCSVHARRSREAAARGRGVAMKPYPQHIKFGKAVKRRWRIVAGDGLSDAPAPMPQGAPMAQLIAERKAKTRGTL